MANRTVEAIDREIAECKEELANVKGRETEVYTRIVGYYRAVKNWNKGKKSEFKQREKPLIVFCSSRDGVEITARRLKKHLEDQDVWFYHAGLSREEKKKIEDKFFVSKEGVLVATCAYGMGSFALASALVRL